MNILLSGANGYIGRRLLPILVQSNHHVICLVRDKNRIEIEEELLEHISILEIDLLDENLGKIDQKIDCAFYLVHSLGSSKSNFNELEEKLAHNFTHLLNGSGCKQIIYLSGIANDSGLSKHLLSRRKTEEILMQSDIPVTVLRAAIIIGSGGASFEIIRDLVEKLPIMVAPKWLKTRCQPIAIRNVIQYLEGIMLKEASYNQIYDIGGPDILTYKEMLMDFAEVRELKRWIFTVPVLTPRLSSYWLHFVTSTTFNIARNLVDSMMNEVIVEKKGIEKIVDIELITYKDAVKLAFDRIAQNEVISSWKDAVAGSNIQQNLLEFVQVPVYGCFHDNKKRSLEEKDITRVVKNIWQIGGDNGWYYLTFLWKIRGYLDKAVGGVGLRRGRRSPDQLIAGDALDFWRVLVADKKEMRLLLYAEMKLPGEAWLEFKIKKNTDNTYAMYQNATFRPQGVWGRIYWYTVLPFHLFIFDGMINQIVSRGIKS